MKINILLLFITLLAIFFLLECGFRMAGFHGVNIDFNPITYSNELGWKLKSNYKGQWTSLEWDIPYETNSQGFRDNEHLYKKGKGIKRIAILGDSQAEGWGVSFEDMWQSILLEKLGARFEIVNFGTRGYDIIQEFKQFMQVVRYYNPDIVLQILDPSDYLKTPNATVMANVECLRPNYILKNNTIQFIDGGAEPLSITSDNSMLVMIKRALFHKSAFLTWLKFKIVQLPKINNILIKMGFRKNVKSALNSGNYYDREYRKAIEIIFGEFARLEKELNFKLIVIYLGNEMVPDLKELVETKTGHFLQVKLIPSQRWKYDVHPNCSGHKMIAEAIWEYLI